MGGMSYGKLMAAELFDTEGDPIELFLGSLRKEKNDKDEECLDEEYEDEEYPDSSTIVGQKLHEPTFEDSWDDDKKKVGHLKSYM